MIKRSMAALCFAAVAVATASSLCPANTVQVDTFTRVASSPTAAAHLDDDDATWVACEDLTSPSGGIALVPTTAGAANGRTSSAAVWLPKTYEPFARAPDSAYYLEINKTTMLEAKWDMLGQKVLTECAAHERYANLCEPTWARIEQALPVMRFSGGNRAARAGGNQEWMCSPYGTETGVRTFVGSRSSSVDATFSDHADDCTDNGFPRPQSYVMNLTAIASGEPAIKDFINYVNFTEMADGLVGDFDPNVIFYFPIIPQNSSWHDKAGKGWTGTRYWTMIASPVPDMQGGREQSVWFRFQQIHCGDNTYAPSGRSFTELVTDASCKLRGAPQYYDTYWYSASPGNITSQWIPPEFTANADGFYSNMLDVHEYWEQTLKDEGMMELSLPETMLNNGTWLSSQATFSIVRSMISREDTWHGRYGVTPGYGISLQDGFEDTFTASATAALEMGSFPYAKGVIDNWLSFYVRDNGMTTYRAEELAQAGRMLTIFAMYVEMTGDDALLLKHWKKAKALATWLKYRWELSLTQFPSTDPRHGIPPGGDEGDGFIAIFAGFPGSHDGNANQLSHKYSCAGGIYRGFRDIGLMWTQLGARAKRPDIVAHGKDLLTIAPKMRAAIQASIAKTTKKVIVHGKPFTCIPNGADPKKVLSPPTDPNAVCTDGGGRSYPELFYSGVLTKEQANDIYETLTTSNGSYVTRPITLGCAGYNNKQVTFWSYGLAYGLLQHDMVERFLLHYFAMSAHTYTRGSQTTPEAVHPDRDVASTDYVAAGVVTASTYLKWMLVYEEPDNRTVWLGKAIPRDWLHYETAQPIVVKNATTRYGRVSYTLTPKSHEPGMSVHASVTLPSTYAAGASSAPAGGLKLRIRVPLPFAGKLKSVTVGGVPWPHIDPKEETIVFTPQSLTQATMSGLANIVATFGI